MQSSSNSTSNIYREKLEWRMSIGKSNNDISTSKLLDVRDWQTICPSVFLCVKLIRFVTALNGDNSHQFSIIGVRKLPTSPRRCFLTLETSISHGIGGKFLYKNFYLLFISFYFLGGKLTFLWIYNYAALLYPFLFEKQILST